MSKQVVVLVAEVRVQLGIVEDGAVRARTEPMAMEVRPEDLPEKLTEWLDRLRSSLIEQMESGEVEV